MPTVAFHTLGCKVNHYESEAMMDLFKEAGYQIVDFEEKADIYIVNSCTVTNEAARKTRQIARRAKRRNAEATVVIVGCYAQVSPEEVREMDEVDLVLGSSLRSEIVKLVEDVVASGEKFNNVVNFQKLTEYEDLEVVEVRETTRAYVKIEEGCNQFCSYCIIPFARGPVRSRPIDSILNEVNHLVSRGVKEIILTGTHLGAYGFDWKNEQALTELLIKLLRSEGEFRIRLSSIEVTEINDRLINLLASEPQLCPHLHLPLQSGSDMVLKMMNRPYQTGDFAATVNKLREKIPEIALTTDVIVGFPGEDQQEFEQSYRFIEKIGFSRLHVFPFSPREGTPAAKKKDQLPGGVKKEYSSKLRELNEKLMEHYQQKFIGQTREVIIEEKRDHQTGLLTGVTDNYLRVLLEGDDEYQGQLVNVKLLEPFNYENVKGEIIVKG